MSTRANVAGDEAITSGPPGGPSRLPDHNGRLAVFDLDRTLLPGSSLSLFGRALHQAGMVGSRRMAGYIAREAVFVRRGQGVSSAHRLLAALLADVADREAGPLLDVAEGLGDDLARTARPGARWRSTPTGVCAARPTCRAGPSSPSDATLLPSSGRR